jgi:hypothetical protein
MSTQSGLARGKRALIGRFRNYVLPGQLEDRIGCRALKQKTRAGTGPDAGSWTSQTYSWWDRIAVNTSEPHRPRMMRPMPPMRPMPRLRILPLRSPYKDVFSEVSISDLEVGNTAVQPFSSLLGSKLVAADGTFPGTMNNNRFDSESLLNPYGEYGSPYHPRSIFNRFGEYGSPYGNFSPFNVYGKPAHH